MSNYIIRMGQVVSLADESDGMRIKVKLSQDEDDVPIEDLPYAFPLLPKTIQSMPKLNEMVLVFCSEIRNIKSNRFYLGPVISQPQFFELERYNGSYGTTLSLLQGGAVKPLPTITRYDSTKGSFPNKNDIALIGRKSEDVILKDGEIDLRCGIREKSLGNDDLLGNVIFNNVNPAYIQLKFQKNIGKSDDQEADSIINLVADKINIISHKGDKITREKLKITDKNDLIDSSEMDNIMSKLHELPYGDELVRVLNIIRDSIIHHVHPYPGLSACLSGPVMTLLGTDFNKILSDNVRIN